MKIKEAYDALVEAIKEETGATPSITINFHACYNERLRDASEALRVAKIMAEQLETKQPVYDESEGRTWFCVHDYRTDPGINFAVFM
jgi:hypothetical protein